MGESNPRAIQLPFEVDFGSNLLGWAVLLALGRVLFLLGWGILLALEDGDLDVLEDGRQ